LLGGRRKKPRKRASVVVRNPVHLPSVIRRLEKNLVSLANLCAPPPNCSSLWERWVRIGKQRKGAGLGHLK